MSKDLIIFDLYGTLLIDHFVEERKKYCIDAIWSLLEKEKLPIRFAQIIEAYDLTLEYVLDAQKKEFVTYSIFEMVRFFCAKISLTDIAHLKKIHDIWAYAILHMPPQLRPYVKDGLEEIKAHNKKIALISDSILTPGVALRFFLQEQGIYYLFDDFVFSDEFGLLKPTSAIFNRILDRLKIAPNKTLLVGDHQFYDKQNATNLGIDYCSMSLETDFRNIIKKIL
ncbi:MAG: HAD family hydrolase [Brevinema sp.]